MGEDADTSLLLHVVLTYVDLARQHQANSHRHPSAKHAKTTAPSPHPYTSLTNTMRDFLHEDAELFVHEVAKFMASRVNMAEYDRDPDPCAHDATDRQ
ncbi:hypothetical protein DYB32_000056 [Aphanomyces invadans]|uniref:Uncharacterized protein n=1 Tax=Aphanomyces invadans TaxID=157072 RepID=A0A418BB81_9STRA|nr:hypothetical protein DYB32_000056 [Aphanomyces invadans]